MPLQTRRDLLIAIDGLELAQRSPRREFLRRGHAEFFGSEFPMPDSPKGVLIEFIRYFCFDSGEVDARFNGFQEPWVVLVTLCSMATTRVRVRGGFQDGLTGLVRSDSARWSDYRHLLSESLVERA